MGGTVCTLTDLVLVMRAVSVSSPHLAKNTFAKSTFATAPKNSRSRYFPPVAKNVAHLRDGMNRNGRKFLSSA